MYHIYLFTREYFKWEKCIYDGSSLLPVATFVFNKLNCVDYIDR